jgi:peroxiredoxin
VSHDPTALPADLPVPTDDGAAHHLPGATVPALELVASSGGTVDLRERSAGRRVVVFAYPRTGQPDIAPPVGWDDIPGARGCTPEACAFRDLTAEFTDAGAEVFGLSTQDPGYQLEAATRLLLPYPLLSDADLQLTRALRLPTFTVDGIILLRRLTMIIRDGAIEYVLYPVWPPDQAAADALAALKR